MSIIADTLQRLQTHRHQEKSEVTEKATLVMPGRGKREPGWHTRPSRWKFGLTGLSMLLGLSSLALGAYWVGGYWDFGLSTYASPGTVHPLSASEPVPTPERALLDSFSEESPTMREEFSLQSASVSSSLRSEEGSATSDNPIMIPDSVSPEVVGLPEHENQPFAPTGTHVSVSALDTAPAPSSVSRSAHSPALPADKATPLADKATPRSTAEFSPRQEHTNMKTPERDPSPMKDPLPALPLPGAPFEKQEVSAVPLLEKASFEKESPGMPVQAQGEISRQSLTNISSVPSSPSEKQAFHDFPEAQRPMVPVSLSMADRLRQAQESIQTGKYEEAVSSLLPLFEKPPDHWEPWFWMGTALLGQNELEQADQYFLNGLARNDKIPQLWIQRALVAHQRGEYQLAIHELRRAESLDAGLPHTYLNMGYAYEKLGNARLANEYYGRFLKASEGDPTFFSTRKKLYAHFTDQMNSTPRQTPLAPLPGTP